MIPSAGTDHELSIKRRPPRQRPSQRNRGLEDMRRSQLRKLRCSLSRGRILKMNRIVLSTAAVLVALVGFAMMGQDQEATAGLFGRKCCKPACCEPEPTCCEPAPCSCKKPGLFARMKAKKCCKPACCEPAPCCAPEPTCCEAPACAPSCGCEAAPSCGCEAAPACGCGAAAPACGCEGAVIMDSAPAAAPEAAPAAPEAPAPPAAPST